MKTFYVWRKEENKEKKRKKEPRHFPTGIAPQNGIRGIRDRGTGGVVDSYPHSFFLSVYNRGFEANYFVSLNMAKHHPDLVFCRKQPGIALGRLCEKCDGKCVICDSYVRPHVFVHICDECNYGSFEGRCIICGAPGISDAYYCRECTLQEKDRDGCPKIINLGSSRTDLFYERKKYGFKKR